MTLRRDSRFAIREPRIPTRLTSHPLLTRALSTNRQLTKTGSETHDPLNSLAEVFWHQGRYADAERMYLELVEWCKATLGPHHR
jgi:hypothetical protein